MLGVFAPFRVPGWGWILHVCQEILRIFQQMTCKLLHWDIGCCVSQNAYYFCHPVWKRNLPYSLGLCVLWYFFLFFLHFLFWWDSWRWEWRHFFAIALFDADARSASFPSKISWLLVTWCSVILLTWSGEDATSQANFFSCTFIISYSVLFWKLYFIILSISSYKSLDSSSLLVILIDKILFKAREVYILQNLSSFWACHHRVGGYMGVALEEVLLHQFPGFSSVTWSSRYILWICSNT